jgi:hypothetical protein
METYDSLRIALHGRSARIWCDTLERWHLTVTAPKHKHYQGPFVEILRALHEDNALEAAGTRPCSEDSNE